MTDEPTLPPPRLGDRALFPELEAFAYLNHAGVSPPSQAVKAAVEGALATYARGGAAAVGAALELRRRLRDRLARLLSCRPGDLALTGGATHGIQAIALSLPWRAGDRVVLFEGEFPANVTPWQRAAELFDLRLAFVPLAPFLRSAEEGLSALAAELEQGAHLVAVSAVQFRSGLAMPLTGMAALCARHGAELFVDAIQALGAMSLDAPALGVDYLAGGGHKWLMGLEGAGLLYVRPERVAALRPALAGWLSHEEPVSFLTEGAHHLRYDRPLRREASVFEAGSASVLSAAALEASVGLLQELGVEVVRRHVLAYLDRLEPRLVERGFKSLRAPGEGGRSGILSVEPPPGCDGPALRERLSAAGVAVALPDGALRFAPHWPNDAELEVPRVVEAVDAALG